MSKSIIPTFTFFLLLLSQSAFSESPDTTNSDTITMENLRGGQQSLEDYVGKGKWVVVNVWATACPYCRQEIFDLASFHDKHHKENAMVLGLTLDFPSFGLPNKESLKGFALDYFIDYPLLLVDREIASNVIGQPVDMIPLTFFYNPEGKLVHRINGVVTEKMMEEVIQTAESEYQVEWADQIPPEYRPKNQAE